MTEDWSVPETEVLAAVRDLLAGDREGVLATVVDVEGSAYRRPGAKMVVTADGEGTGAITAGCLEDEVQQLAREVLDAGEPRVETYDLMDDDGDDVWGLGVGCNGIIDVLLEPLSDADAYRPAVEANERGEDVAVLTVLDGPTDGRRAYYHPGRDAFEGVGVPEAAREALREPAADLAGRGRADTVTVETPDGDVTVFVDGVAAPPELVVFGSGHDVGPVVDLAKRNDFRVTVCAFRGAVDLAARFPAADRRLSVAAPRVGEELDLDDDTYAVVASHNFVDDRLAVEALLDSPVPYVGLMGPHERFEEMLEEFREEGRAFGEDDLESLYTPVGLDLGGGSPHQIATSIVAEVLAVHNDRDPGHLRDRKGHIHERVELAPDGQ
ncbi:MAG: XdhC family protein [Haloferacaceae archaeon]